MATSRGDARTRRYDQNRERVIDVAARLFAQQGYAATGVAQIGDEAELARGALYYYIGSKDALLEAIHDRVMDPLLTDAVKIYTLDYRASVRLKLLSESLMDQVVNKRDHVWVFLHEYHQLEGESRTRFREKRSDFESYVTRLLADGVAKGEFNVADLRLATLAWLNLHNYTYQWLRSERGLDARRLSDFYIDLFFSGIAVAKPSEEFWQETAQAREALAREEGSSGNPADIVTSVETTAS